MSCGDFDGDGDLDLVVSGNTSNTGAELVTTVYRNDGDGRFTDIQADLPGLRFCGVAWGDLDRDGDLDLLSAGVGQESWMATVFRNDGAANNTLPGIPTGLSATSEGGVTTLRWAAASDGQTPSAGLGYDLRVGTSAGAGDVVSVATTASGEPLSPGTRNVPSGEKAVLRLPAGSLPCQCAVGGHRLRGVGILVRLHLRGRRPRRRLRSSPVSGSCPMAASRSSSSATRRDIP